MGIKGERSVRAKAGVSGGPRFVSGVTRGAWPMRKQTLSARCVALRRAARGKNLQSLAKHG